MKKLLIGVALLTLAGCGDTSRHNEVIGQAKRVVNQTPLICMDYPAFDLSLGVMRNGTGSMSTQDQWFTVTDDRLLDTLRKAAETGALVKVTYDVRRWAPCSYDHWLTAVEIVQ